MAKANCWPFLQSSCFIQSTDFKMAGRVGGLGEERVADAAIQEIADKVINKSTDHSLYYCC